MALPKSFLLLAFALALPSSLSLDITPFLMVDPLPIIRAHDPKLYVYKESDNPKHFPALFANKKVPGCKGSMWGTEHHVYTLMTKSNFTTDDPAAASMFYFPSFFKCDTWQYSKDTLAIREKRLTKALSSMPYFIRSVGPIYALSFMFLYTTIMLFALMVSIWTGLELLSAPTLYVSKALLHLLQFSLMHSVP